MSKIVYRFSDLSDEAKDRVRDSYTEDWSRAEDFLPSLKALTEHFDGNLRDYSIDWSGGSHSYVKFDMPDIGELGDMSEAEDEDGYVDEEKLEELHRKEIQRRLDKLSGELTGTTYGETVIDGFREAFLSGESDLNKLMQSAFHTLLSAAERDYNYDFSDEGMEETCEGMWFDEYGNYANPPGEDRVSKTVDTIARIMLMPHGRCSREGYCVEHASNRHIPSCMPKQKSSKGRHRK